MSKWLSVVILYISINFLLLILFRNSEYLIKRLLVFHIIFMLFLFIKGIVFFIKNKNISNAHTNNI